MNNTKEKPYFRKETDHFVLYKPATLPKKQRQPSENISLLSTSQIVGRYKTWQEAQIESLRHFGRKASKVS